MYFPIYFISLNFTLLLCVSHSSFNVPSNIYSFMDTITKNCNEYSILDILYISYILYIFAL